MLISRKCRICGKTFTTSFRQYTLCPKCWHTQPKCGSCHIVMAPQYGSLESFARKVGKFGVCSGCNYELRRKGFLHISETQWLFPSGRVRFRRLPLEDKI